MSISSSVNNSILQAERELYFLIARFLTTGPCKKTSEVFLRELEERELLPRRIDWEGKEHYRNFDELLALNRHVSPDYLLRLCTHLVTLVERELPPGVKHLQSILGAGSYSLLRKKDDPTHSSWTIKQYSRTQHAKCLPLPHNYRDAPNLALVLGGREMCGSVRFEAVLPTRSYAKINLLFKALGHLTAVYCVTFDRTGEYIMTGADDNLVKIWSLVSGRLLATLRGCSAEISDIAVNYENTLVAAASCDKTIRIWNLQTTAPVAVLQCHTGIVSSVRFCPVISSEMRYLVSTGVDGNVCYWRWNHYTLTFDSKPVKFSERASVGAQIICSSFSSGGIFLATGSSDHVVRVYGLSHGVPEKIAELEAHTDQVDSIQYANHSARFLSGSRDGTARLWQYRRQEWKAVVFNASERLHSQMMREEEEEALVRQAKVTMVGWSSDDQYAVVACSDFAVRVWHTITGQLVYVLQGHEDDVFVLEACHADARILLTAGHDSRIVLWDLSTGTMIKSHRNMTPGPIPGQTQAAVLDCRWSPDGQSFAATDGHGFLLFFGFGSSDKYKQVPEEQFFHTDYRPLIRDSNGYVLDEQTQQPPHLMAPPFLVDVDGNPYSPERQRLVPGRENCRDQQLVPQVAIMPSGVREVLDEVIVEENIENDNQQRPSIDQRIAELARQQQQQSVRERGGALSRREGNRSVRSNRRQGNEETLRQQQDEVVADVLPRPVMGTGVWNDRICVHRLNKFALRKRDKYHQHMADDEIKKFTSESRRRPYNEKCGSNEFYMRTRGQVNARQDLPSSVTGRKEESIINRLTVRALYDTEEDEQVEEVIEDTWLSVHESESSDYSDWMADEGTSMRPPERSSRRSSQRSSRRKRSSRVVVPHDTDEEEEDEEQEEQEDEHDEEREHRRESRRKIKKRKHVKSPRKQKHHREGKVKRDKQRKTRSSDVPARALLKNGIRELPEEFRPPEWLTDAVPRKAPYFPQIGDELVYFPQGYEHYLQEVKKRKVYDCKNTSWQRLMRSDSPRDHEYVKVVGVKHEMRPPRLVCLKLAIVDADSGRTTGAMFTIKYHDMPDVVDFLVLRQSFDVAIQRDWKVGDRFRCMIDDEWWHGCITGREPLQREYINSLFQCFITEWDTGEEERMSPWDMEPIDTTRLASAVGIGVEVTQSDLRALMYVPKPNEWPRGDREAECVRIIRGFEQIMQLSVAEQFLAPVDLNEFPDYAMMIAYPMDLSLIVARLHNRFYRRVAALQFDVRYIERNTADYNVPGSKIVTAAKLVTELCLRFIGNSDCTDAMPIYNELVEDEEFGDCVQSEEQSSDDGDDESVAEENDDSAGEGPSSGLRYKTRNERRSNRNLPTSSAPNVIGGMISSQWVEQCKQLIASTLNLEDAEPFRQAVDPIEYPHYYRIIRSPIDLSIIQNRLESGRYKQPLDFCEDIHLMLNNSRKFNTNRRSRIFAMTQHLSAYLEERMQNIIMEWNRMRKRQENNDRKNKSKDVGRSSNSMNNKAMRSHQSTKEIKKQAKQRVSEDHSSDDDKQHVWKQKSKKTLRSLNQKHLVNGESKKRKTEVHRGDKPTKYSTRTATGSLKPKKYEMESDEEGFQVADNNSDHNDNDSPHHTQRKRIRHQPTDSDDSDDTHQLLRKRTRLQHPEDDSDDSAKSGPIVRSRHQKSNEMISSNKRTQSDELESSERIRRTRSSNSPDRPLRIGGSVISPDRHSQTTISRTLDRHLRSSNSIVVDHNRLTQINRSPDRQRRSASGVSHDRQESHKQKESDKHDKLSEKHNCAKGEPKKVAIDKNKKPRNNETLVTHASEGKFRVKSSIRLLHHSDEESDESRKETTKDVDDDEDDSDKDDDGDEDDNEEESDDESDEESDEESNEESDENEKKSKKKILKNKQALAGLGNTCVTRNQGKRTCFYREQASDDDLDDNDEVDDNDVSVSSRGRIRKLKAHARSVFH